MLPVYDYVLMTERLSESQLAALGWANRQGLTDGGNQFHYFRLTADDRILYGGYDAIYHWRNDVGGHRDERHETFSMLAEHLIETFPQLEGIRFTHRWGGAIDTCSRFFAFYGTALDGHVSYAVGYTGLGVGASRFGAEVALDLVDGLDTPLAAAARAHPAAHVPARAAAFGGSGADPPRARARRSQRGPAQPLPQGPRPHRARASTRRKLSRNERGVWSVWIVLRSGEPARLHVRGPPVHVCAGWPARPPATRSPLGVRRGVPGEWSASGLRGFAGLPPGSWKGVPPVL